MNLNLFKKYLDNRCSNNEVDNFFEWVNDDATTPESYLFVKSYWDSIKPASEDESQKEQRLNAIHHRINLNRYKKRFATDNRRRLIQIFYRAAVVLLIPVITLFIYTRFFEDSNYSVMNEPIMNEIISPVGSRISLSLADGTKVWLNHGSSLVYPQKFVGKTRAVKLKGEGYFEVVKNPKRPFVVETELLDVVATGTKFNVKAYDTDNAFHATLKSGKIHIQGDNLEAVEILPGQQCRLYKKTNKLRIRKVDPNKYIAWIDGKLMFDNDRFTNVANRLSRWYNVDIQILEPEIEELTYTGTFIDEPLYQIFEMLEVVSPVDFEVMERSKNPDGTYSKRIIKVKIKK